MPPPTLRRGGIKNEIDVKIYFVHGFYKFHTRVGFCITPWNSWQFNHCILLVLTLLMCDNGWLRGEKMGLINSIFVYKVYFCLFENYSIIHIVHRTQNPQLPAKVKRGITQGIAKSIKTFCINFKWSAFLELKLLNLRNWYFFW